MYKRLNITLPDTLLERADEFAHSERYTRSGLIAAALEAYMADEVADVTLLAGASVANEATALYETAERHAELSAERIGALARAFFLARDDVEAAWLFGSVARGVAGSMSDVDLAVLPAGDPDREARTDLRLDLMSRLPEVFGVQEVDVAVLPDVSVLLGHRALVEGSRIVGEGSRRAAEAEIRAANAYWDLEPMRRMQSARLSERLGGHGPR